MDAASALITFLLVFGLDYVWARYTRAVTAHSVVSACVYSVLIYMFSSFAVISYVENHWMLLPAAAGAVAGTWVAMKMEKQ